MYYLRLSTFPVFIGNCISISELFRLADLFYEWNIILLFHLPMLSNDTHLKGLTQNWFYWIALNSLRFILDYPLHSSWYSDDLLYGSAKSLDVVVPVQHLADVHVVDGVVFEPLAQVVSLHARLCLEYSKWNGPTTCICQRSGIYTTFQLSIRMSDLVQKKKNLNLVFGFGQNVIQ